MKKSFTRKTTMTTSGSAPMDAIQFVVDDKGAKRAVLIDLDKYGDLWEDFYDCLIAHLRKDEPRESLKKVKKHLSRSGKLDV